MKIGDLVTFTIDSLSESNPKSDMVNWDENKGWGIVASIGDEYQRDINHTIIEVYTKEEFVFFFLHELSTIK